MSAEAGQRGRRLADPRFDAVIPWLVLIVATACSILRLPQAALTTVWAEDGALFLEEAQSDGGWSQLFVVYQGYLHVVPRIVTAFALQLPIEAYASAMAVGSTVVVGVVSAAVYVCSRSVVERRLPRLALAAITVLLPLAPYEVLGNAANLHWYFLWLAPWLLLHVPAGRLEAVALSALAFLAATTEIQVALFLPLLLWRWRERLAWPQRGALLLGVALQIAAVLTHARDVGDEPAPDVLSTLKGFLLNVLLTLVAPHGESIGAIVLASGFWPAVLLGIPFLAALVLVLVRGRGPLRVAALSAAIAAPILWSAGFVLNPNPGFGYDHYSSDQFEAFEPLRYGVVPGMLLASLLVIGAEALRSRGGRAATVTAIAVTMAVPVAMLAWFAGSPSTRDDGPSWSAQFSEAEAVCATGEDEAVLHTAPSQWVVGVDCRLIQE